jgi:glutaminyl-peptide cyclotransferase
VNACRLYCLILPLVLPSFGCQQNHPTATASNSAVAQPTDQQPGPASQVVTPVGPQLRINPDRAMQYVKEIVAFGPRWDGSPGQQKLGAYLHNKLKAAGAQVDEDAFTQQTPAGPIPIRNIIGKFPGSKDGVIVLASHIDTNYPLRNTKFIGANDGASSTALLLAIADQLRGHKLQGYSVWLAFLDGEESIPSDRPGDLRWDDNQSLYGSRHLAQKWQQDGTIKKVKAFMLADMIGDKDLGILRDQNSTPWLLDLIAQAAESLGYQSYFFAQTTGVTDDHVPFQQAGAPVADIIDLDYGYNNAFHHTTEDTVDKLSPKSLQITGDVILETFRLINGREH